MDTLGSLYQSAQAAPAAVEIVYQRLRLALSRRLGTPLNAKLPALCAASEERLGWPADTLFHTLSDAERAMRDINLENGEALDLVRSLHGYLQRLEYSAETRGRGTFMEMSVADLASHVRREFAKIIVGQNEALDQLLLVILARGHALVEGVPGLAKTLAVKSLAHIFHLRFQRVQCTPDLIPADILGGNISAPAAGTFRIHRGPIFTDLLLVDEINRMPPRTQSALLEAMEELQVTMDGPTHPLPRTFTVFATQNPVEFEGAYPLPEAQLDRFLMKIRVEYPQVTQETEILARYQDGFEARSFERVQIDPLPEDALQSAREECARVRVEPKLLDYIVSIVRATRNSPAVSLGASPRAAISLMLVGKAIAAIEGRDFLIPDNVKFAAPPILRHRMLLKPEADLEGITPDQVVAEVLAGTAVPQ